MRNSKLKPAALLWDESFLWGVMAHKALMSAGLSCDLMRSEDVKGGRLREYSLLFVPGGWASNKVKSLGNDGIEEIKRFVNDGGAYLGFCGGAGLATMDGIGLVPVRRRPTKERVPSFSGRIKLNVNDHPLWENVSDCKAVHSEIRNPKSEMIFHAWWPSQFVIDGNGVAVLATYGEAMPDSFSSDVNVGDAEAAGRWPQLESIYRINLDPKRLLNEPAVIEGAFGKGTVLLSLVHFDTPGDGNGAMMLQRLWKYFGIDPIQKSAAEPTSREGQLRVAAHDPILSELEAEVNDLVNLGFRNFLWFWRNAMLLQWRRGVRGLEYCTLFIMVHEIAAILRSRNPQDGPTSDKNLEHIRDLLLPFAAKAKHLLVLERFAMQNAPITYERCDDPEMQAVRDELFSRSKSHGGLFKELLDELDRLLYSAMTSG